MVETGTKTGSNYYKCQKTTWEIINKCNFERQLRFLIVHCNSHVTKFAENAILITNRCKMQKTMRNSQSSVNMTIFWKDLRPGRHLSIKKGWSRISSLIKRNRSTEKGSNWGVDCKDKGRQNNKSLFFFHSMSSFNFLPCHPYPKLHWTFVDRRCL